MTEGFGELNPEAFLITSPIFTASLLVDLREI